MKKNLFVIRKMVIGFTLVAAFIINSTPVFSKGNAQGTVTSSITQPSVKYIGADNNGAFFQVKFDNEAPVKFKLTVSDDNGNVLYNEDFLAASFSQYIKLLSESSTNSKLHFCILTADGTKFEFDVTTEQVAPK